MFTCSLEYLSMRECVAFNDTFLSHWQKTGLGLICFTWARWSWLPGGYYDHFIITNGIAVLVWRHPLRWRHNERDGISNYQSHHRLLSRISSADQRKQSPASLAFVLGIHLWPVMRKMFYLMTSSWVYWSRAWVATPMMPLSCCLQ